jgi:hypothetical protein
MPYGCGRYACDIISDDCAQKHCQVGGRARALQPAWDDGPPNPYRGFAAEIIEHAVWLYPCFSLSLRDVELILAARGVVVR